MRQLRATVDDRAPWPRPAGARLGAALCCALILVGILPGCYSFNTSLPGHIKTVMVPVFRNETLQSEIPEDLATALTNRFLRDNRLKVVQSNPDAILEGIITGYEDRVFGFNTDQQADEYVVVITVSVAFRDRVKNKELWREDTLRGVGNYIVGVSDPSQPSTNIDAQATAIQQIVDFTMSRTFEGW